jgi:hypothetical protein
VDSSRYFVVKVGWMLSPRLAMLSAKALHVRSVASLSDGVQPPSLTAHELALEVHSWVQGFPSACVCTPAVNCACMRCCAVLRLYVVPRRWLTASHASMLSLGLALGEAATQ